MVYWECNQISGIWLVHKWNILRKKDERTLKIPLFYCSFNFLYYVLIFLYTCFCICKCMVEVTVWAAHVQYIHFAGVHTSNQYMSCSSDQEESFYADSSFEDTYQKVNVLIFLLSSCQPQTKWLKTFIWSFWFLV